MRRRSARSLPRKPPPLPTRSAPTSRSAPGSISRPSPTAFPSAVAAVSSEIDAFQRGGAPVDWDRGGTHDLKPTDIGHPDYFHKVVDCQWACPAHTPVPEYIRMIAQGRYGD